VDEEEKLRILIIIEKLLKEQKIEPFRLERIRDELKRGSKISEEEKNFVLDQWEKYHDKDSIKKLKPSQLNSRVKILVIGLVIVTIVIPVSLLALSQTTDTTPQNPISQKIAESDTTVSTNNSPETTVNKTFPDTQNEFLQKFRKLENKEDIILLEYVADVKPDNILFHGYDIIRIQSENIYGDYLDSSCNQREKEVDFDLMNFLLDEDDEYTLFLKECKKEFIRTDTLKTKVGSLLLSTSDGYVEIINIQVDHNFDIDVMGIAALLYEKIGKEYVYAWSDEACLDDRYNDKCFADGYNNKHMHFLNGGPEGLEMRERSEIISDVYVSVKRDFKKSFTVNFVSN